MSTAGLAGVNPEYVHVTKVITPAPLLQLGEGAILKWYDIAAPDTPVPADLAALARRSLVDAFAAGALEVTGLGFVILHRCGDAFYFLIVATWAGDNEVWETVWAKNGPDAAFRPWPTEGSHRPTFCVWELGAVWHEQQAWSRFLRSARSPSDEQAYLGESVRGPA